MSRKAYPHYKPSGVEWTGDMPWARGRVHGDFGAE